MAGKDPGAARRTILRWLLVRLLALDGMETFFVPFLTDMKNAYSRVRLCCQAWTVENECFVGVAGNVRNLLDRRTDLNDLVRR